MFRGFLLKQISWFDRLSQFVKIKKKKQKYEFRVPKDGYLSYAHPLSNRSRKLLTLLLNFLNWIIDKREKNIRVNKSILRGLDLDENTPLNSLDAFYKQEFRKKKYMYCFKSKPAKNLPEPIIYNTYCLPKNPSQDKRFSPSEFFSSFGVS